MKKTIARRGLGFTPFIALCEWEVPKWEQNASYRNFESRLKRDALFLLFSMVIFFLFLGWLAVSAPP